MVEILPSLASANQLCLEQEIQKVQHLGRLHFDIEDGNFVPNITFGMKTVKSACSILRNVCCDAHLMVTNPEDYLEELSELNFSAVAFHWESVAYPMRLIHAIHKRNMKAGIALNPRTSASSVTDYLSKADYMLLMSSEPDRAGEKFQEQVLGKIEFMRRSNPDLEIVVDGGIDEMNFGRIAVSGATKAVIGRAVFQAKDVDDLISKLRKKEREKV